MRCPICGHWVEDDDYWCGDRCLRCALKREQSGDECRAYLRANAAAWESATP